MNTSYFDGIEIFKGKFNLLSYHIPYLKQFCTEFDVRGRDILEVGGTPQSQKPRSASTISRVNIVINLQMKL
jgi:hypothetical protein